MRESERGRESMRRAIDHCRKAKQQLGRHGSFRTRVLLDMVLLELESEMARRDGKVPENCLTAPVDNP